MSTTSSRTGGWPSWMTGPARAGVFAWITAAGIAAVVFARSIGPGEYLYRDFVGVPSPARPASLFPTSPTDLRSWPLDAVTWALSAFVPVGVQQAAMLVGGVLLAGAGAGVLVRHLGSAAAAAAASVAAWNPYVSERLLVGQPPTLLGYAALPWVFMAARSRRPTAVRLALLVVAALPAALTPWGGVMAGVAGVAGAATRFDRTTEGGRTGLRWLAVAAGAAVLWCLPWAVPSLLAGAPTGDSSGAAAFALTDDTGLGTFWSSLFGGGIWASAGVPLSRQDPLAVGASLLLLAGAMVGLVILVRRRRPVLATLAAVAVVGPALTAWLASGALLGVATRLQAVPGFSLLRDLHRDLAPAVVTAAVLLGVAVSALRTQGSRVAMAGAALSALALSVISVPDLPRDVAASYRPVTFPADWRSLVTAIRSQPGAVVVSLPWQPLRQTQWAGDRPFLDPLPRAVRESVLTSHVLTVSRDGQTWVVDEGAPKYAAGWAAGAVRPESLHQAGATLVVEWVGSPGPAVTGAGWRLLLSGPHFRLWRLPVVG